MCTYVYGSFKKARVAKAVCPILRTWPEALRKVLYVGSCSSGRRVAVVEVRELRVRRAGPVYCGYGGCLWEDSGLPSRGNGVLVTQVYWEVSPKGRSCCAFGSRRLKVGARVVLETRSRCM